MNTEETQFAALQQRLQNVFPTASVVLVQQLYEGFRRRTDEFVLLVEVTQAEETSPVVVKLGPADRLEKELTAWQSCRPAGLKHDLVLMDLEPLRDAQGILTALVYADAEQLIGVDQTLSLEAAMQDAIRLGEPTLESVADVLFQMYERLGLLLYKHSFVDHVKADATREQRLLWLDGHLEENLNAWSVLSGDAFNLRSGITTDLDATKEEKNGYHDPVNVFQHVLKDSTPTSEIPNLLRGRSHGDLHGRNVLVGKVGRRVLWPAVYDYGDMSRQNLIAWDFVKMETELKIRVYPWLFSSGQLAIDVVRFEVKLHKETEQSRERGHWPEKPDSASPEDRLFWLLLQIRRLAMRHLKQQGRIRRWLMEYYFVLSLYGLNSIRFQNLEPSELRCALLSSGCAAARCFPP